MTQKLQGKVKFFNPDKGYGFIAVPGHPKEYFLHISGFVGAGPREFNIGDEVSFDLQHGDERGRRAVNVRVNVRAAETPYTPQTRE